MKASKKQLSLLTLYKVSQPIIVLNGAVRTGKTLFGGMFGMTELMINQQKNTHKLGLIEANRYAIVGHANVEATYKNVVSRMITYLKLRGFEITKHPKVHDYTCSREDMQFTIETFSASNTQSYQKLQGGTYRSIFIDEAPLMDANTINEIMTRSTSFPDAKYILTGNPEGSKNHWFYKAYIDEHNPNPSVFYMHFTITDNPTITDEDMQKFKDMFSTATYRRKVLGDWVAHENACYTNELKYSQLIPQEFTNITFGMDYGEVDATTVVCTGYHQDTNKYYILGQYYHKNDESARYDLLQYREQISEWVNMMVATYNSRMYEMYVDPAPTTVFSLMASSDITSKVAIRKVSKHKRTNVSSTQIQERVDVVNAMLSKEMLVSCVKDIPVFAALENAVYKNNMRLDDGTSDIDSLDALEYSLLPDFKYIVDDLGIE